MSANVVIRQDAVLNMHGVNQNSMKSMSCSLKMTRKQKKDVYYYYSMFKNRKPLNFEIRFSRLCSNNCEYFSGNKFCQFYFFKNIFRNG